MPLAKPPPTSTFASRAKVRKGTAIRTSAAGGIIAGLFGLLVAGAGWTTGIIQQYRYLTYKPIPAHVDSSHIETRQGRHGKSYEPVITYTYTVNGNQYQASRVSPLGHISASRAWANDIVTQYAPGNTVTAFHSTSDPASAFLLHHIDSSPYIFALFPSIFVILGIYTIFVAIHARRLYLPLTPLLPSGWFQVAEEGTLSGRFRIAAFSSLAWYGYAGLVIADYAWMNQTIDSFVIITGVICFVVGLIFLIPAWRIWQLHHDFLEADLRVSTNRVRIGDTIQFKLLQQLRRSLEIEQMSLGLVCIRDDRVGSGKQTSYTSIELWSEWKDLQINRFYQPGAALEASDQIAIPPHATPSSPRSFKGYPFFRWYFALGVITTGEPMLAVYFPVTMEAAG